MTIFQDLQAEHEALLNQREAPSDPAQFITEVRRYIDRVCAGAADVSAPRERDQLRAILRFWAAYVYDKTGTYPDTTLRPAMTREEGVLPVASPAPPRRGAGRLKIIAGALIVLILVIGGLVLAPRTLTYTPGTQAAPTKMISAGDVANSIQPLRVDSKAITAGPSPFDPNVWVVRLQLVATGGDGNYIFWVNGQHLPDVSQNQFTIEGKGCIAEHPLVGVTSGGQAISEALVVSSPLPGCPAP